jgi:hypothetical protein
MVMASPKRTALQSQGVTIDMHNVVNGLLGEGLWGSLRLGQIMALVGLAGLAAGLAVSLPSFLVVRGTFAHAVRTGAILVVAASMPLVVAGVTFATGGVFDRNNAVPTVGIAVLIAAVVGRVFEHRPGLGQLALLVVTTWFAVASLADVGDYERAVARGESLVELVGAEVDPTVGYVLVVPSLNTGAGVEAFMYPGELAVALAWEHDDDVWRSVYLPWSERDCAELAEGLRERGPVYVFDRMEVSLRPHVNSDGCGARTALARSSRR